jgi:hypothetical protein
MKSTGKTKKQIAVAKAEHNKLYAATCQYCNQLRAKVQQQSFNLLYLQFDGKQASYFPHIVPLSKNSQNLPKIRTSVYGVSNFSNETTQFYVNFPHWTAGPKLSITILYNSILQFFQTAKYQ